MGHQLLTPPATRNLPEIIKLLVGGKASNADLVSATTSACEAALRRGVKDSAFVEALWLFVRIPKAANTDDFAKALRDIGIVVRYQPSLTDIIIGYDAAVERAQRIARSDITDLGEMARHAGISALSSLADERLPGLWEPTRDDVRTTLAAFCAPEKFGALAQRFFTNFVKRTIHYFLDRALPKHIGEGKLVPSIGDLTVFDSAVTRHCAEATVIMRRFARDWLGKNAFAEKKEISRPDIARFAAYASEKIRKELLIRSASAETF
jgi:hypothetical protein